MVLIQILAAVLLLAGSALIFRALVALESPTRPRLVVRLRRMPTTERDDEAAPQRRAA